ncbi:hypothetical protein ACFL2Q_08700 [Thermodesulfobacteriota bacterium]
MGDDKAVVRTSAADKAADSTVVVRTSVLPSWERIPSADIRPVRQLLETSRRQRLWQAARKQEPQSFYS